jgi:rubredoxin
LANFPRQKNVFFSCNVNNSPKEMPMQKWECPCGYIYNPEEGDYENGVDPGTSWEEVPADWVCPKCGAAKEDFWKAD